MDERSRAVLAAADRWLSAAHAITVADESIMRTTGTHRTRWCRPALSGPDRKQLIDIADKHDRGPIRRGTEHRTASAVRQPSRSRRRRAGSQSERRLLVPPKPPVSQAVTRQSQRIAHQKAKSTSTSLARSIIRKSICLWLVSTL
jgi:hypothetical protein